MIIKSEKEKCQKCGNWYIVDWILYPTKLDDKRDTFYNCPYCKNIINVYLKGNEDVETRKIS